MATLTLEYRDPRELHPHPRNYRAHPPEQIKQIAKSLADFGQYKNIVVTPDGMVIAGHGVVQAAIEAGISELAVYVFDGDEAQVRRMMVADNELSRGAQDDPLALHDLLEEIARDDGDLTGTGWNEREIKEQLDALAAEIIDFTPQVTEDQAGSGTAWNSVQRSECVRLIFGVIEAALPKELYDEVHALCDRAFEQGASYTEAMSMILRQGCDACAWD